MRDGPLASKQLFRSRRGCIKLSSRNTFNALMPCLICSIIRHARVLITLSALIMRFASAIKHARSAVAGGIQRPASDERKPASGLRVGRGLRSCARSSRLDPGECRRLCPLRLDTELIPMQVLHFRREIISRPHSVPSGQTELAELSDEPETAIGPAAVYATDTILRLIQIRHDLAFAVIRFPCQNLIVHRRENSTATHR